MGSLTRDLGRFLRGESTSERDQRIARDQAQEKFAEEQADAAKRAGAEARTRADDAAARARQFEISGQRDSERAERLAASQELQAGRAARSNTARQRFRQARSSRSTVLTGASGPSSRAPVRRRRLFSVLGEGGTRA